MFRARVWRFLIHLSPPLPSPPPLLALATQTNSPRMTRSPEFEPTASPTGARHLPRRFATPLPLLFTPVLSTARKKFLFASSVSCTLNKIWQNDEQQSELFYSNSPFHIFERGCEAVSGKKCKIIIARNCLTSTFKNIVMQMKKVTVKRAIEWQAKIHLFYYYLS